MAVEIIPPDGKDVKRLTYRYANGVVMHHGGLPGYNFGVVFVGADGKACSRLPSSQRLAA